MLLPPKKAYACELMGIFHYFRNEKQFSKIHTQYQNVGQVEAENMFFEVCMDAITVNS